METLKFLFTSSFYPPYHIGGDAVQVSYLAEELAKQGHEVHVLHSLDAYYAKSRNRKDPNGQDLVSTHPIRTSLSRSAIEAYICGSSSTVSNRYQSLVEEVKPDVVHHNNVSLLGHNILLKRGSYLNLYTAHDYWLICPMNDLMRNLRVICHKKTCSSCAIAHRRPPQIWRRVDSSSFTKAISSIDLILCPSEYMRTRLREEIKQRIMTLPNFVPSPPVQTANNFGKMPADYFLFVGALEPHKGIMKLLEVFGEMKHNQDLCLAIVGEGSLKKRIKEFAESRSLLDQVWYQGFVDTARLYFLYRNALALIVPSMWPENAPLVALEAYSVGTPVIGTNIGGLPEIIGKVDKRLLFDDWEELKTILKEFSRARFPSSSVRQVYERDFSPSKYVKDYIDTIRGWNEPNIDEQ